MREILFRGKRVDNGEWVYGNYVHTDCFEDRNDFIGQNDPTKYAIDPETLCEYTGLADKNGKKIFEGDIVQYPVYQGQFRGESIHQVVFERRGGSAYFGITMDDIETWYFCMSVPCDLMEVIGNIYDNPELIGGEKQ